MWNNVSANWNIKRFSQYAVRRRPRRFLIVCNCFKVSPRTSWNSLYVWWAGLWQGSRRRYRTMWSAGGYQWRATLLELRVFQDVWRFLCKVQFGFTGAGHFGGAEASAWKQCTAVSFWLHSGFGCFGFSQAALKTFVRKSGNWNEMESMRRSRKPMTVKCIHISNVPSVFREISRLEPDRIAILNVRTALTK